MWEIAVSDESESLLDTGGAIVKAAPLFGDDSGPILVHNVDIISNADLSSLRDFHKEMNADVTLLTSGRSLPVACFSMYRIISEDGIIGTPESSARRHQPVCPG